MRAVSGLRESLIATLVMAVTSTAADAFWAAAISEHRMLYGLTHGALLLAVMGAVIACATGCRRTGFAALAGLLIGVLAAAAFYLLSPLVGFVAAMVIAWMGLWIAFAFVGNGVARDSETASRTLTRGAIAAVVAGLAFWMVSDIWLGAHDPGPLYWRNLVSWCVAFFPGFAALLLQRTGDR